MPEAERLGAWNCEATMKEPLADAVHKGPAKETESATSADFVKVGDAISKKFGDRLDSVN
ncbi:hypothetical protein CVT26_010491 [Gymnopilus dilepis]|uniref:Uncharacterized protein n=1 Tax=Gymnopilus dilepis TaxID=231916 RepID=A0A409Y0F3_9AGAR|nr:hypothetical protein CVT26_010491 [Gymnopilus dilepis]